MEKVSIFDFVQNWVNPFYSIKIKALPFYKLKMKFEIYELFILRTMQDEKVFINQSKISFPVAYKNDSDSSVM